MITAGIDIGSRTIKLAILKDGELVSSRIELNSHDPLGVCEKILSNERYDTITATGYGRHLFANHYECRVISEIKAFALGINSINRGCRTVIDIGGQDTKAISIGDKGNIIKFEMNDKCAAGTGKFLEIMATALGYTMPEFIEAALSTQESMHINSMCTVFAESEIISLIARGADRAALSHGIHQTIVKRSCAMLRRLQIREEIAFVGGVALNPCIHRLMEEETGMHVYIPENPQLTGAIGCAVCG